jgi:hypothetical protein
MNSIVEAVCNSLDLIAERILNSTVENRNMMAIYGWNNAPLNRQDLANAASIISTQLRTADIEALDEKLEADLDTIPGKLEQLYSSSLVGNMLNGNGASAIPVYISTLTWIQTLISPLIGWQNITDPRAMPAQLAKRVRTLQIEINTLTPDKEALQNQIQLIQDATSAAATLPTDMQDLKEAREKVGKLSEQSTQDSEQISKYLNDSLKAAVGARELELEIDKIVEKSNQALRGATSVGLAGAFEERATALNKSIFNWVGGLVLALIGSIIIGALRYETLASKLNDDKPDWGIITIHITLSVLGLAAPVWFAWLSTKQISQRFKLAEDYAFKASVAKAYEGYRKEAINIDEQFVARLFASALTRLEEAPLRLVGEQEHSSPLQEILASKGFQQAIKSVPDFGNMVAKAIKDSLGVVTDSLNKSKIDKGNETPPSE